MRRADGTRHGVRGRGYVRRARDGVSKAERRKGEDGEARPRAADVAALVFRQAGRRLRPSATRQQAPARRVSIPTVRRARSDTTCMRSRVSLRHRLGMTFTQLTASELVRLIRQILQINTVYACISCRRLASLPPNEPRQCLCGLPEPSFCLTRTQIPVLWHLFRIVTCIPAHAHVTKV